MKCLYAHEQVRNKVGPVRIRSPHRSARRGETYISRQREWIPPGVKEGGGLKGGAPRTIKGGGGGRRR